MTSRLLTIGIFAACALSLVALAAGARVWSSSVADPRTVFARLMARRETRVAVALAWAWVGWHFLVTPPK